MTKNYYILTFTLIFSLTTLNAEQIYKSVDEEGNIVFSDLPISEQSEKIEVKPAQTVKLQQRDSLKLNSRDKNFEDEENYQSVTISLPTNEQTIRDNQGNLTVVIDLQPALLPSHEIVIEIDGVELAKGKSNKVELLNIDRGEHNVLAHIVDGSGNKIASTESTTFFMHRASKLFRERQQNNNQAVTPINPPSGQTEGLSPNSPSQNITGPTPTL